MRKLPSLILQFSTAAVLLTGCTVFSKSSKLHSVKISSTQENADAFTSVEDLGVRVSRLQKGMTDTAVFAILGVSAKKFGTISDDQKMKYVDGPQIPQPYTAEEQDKIKARADSYTVRELAFSSVTTKAGIGLALTTEKHISGFDLKIQVTFKDGLFQKASVPGVMDINRYSRETIIQILGNAVRGGGSAGLEAILKTATINMKP